MSLSNTCRVLACLAALAAAGCGSSGGGTAGQAGAGGASAGAAGTAGNGAGGSSSGGAAGSGGTAASGGTAGTGGAAGTGGGGSGGVDSGTAGTGGAPQLTCADISCTLPATCNDASGTAVCECPVGYTDDNGDGSQCTDIDECTLGTDNCDVHATCSNIDGGFDCTCDAPAYTGDGTACTCASGYTDVSGTCLKDNLQLCGGGVECASGFCVGGVCCGVACDTPGPCEDTAGAVCVGGTSCQYGVAPDNSACDDGNLCTTSTCFAGTCLPVTQTDCSDQDECTTDSCVPSTGLCQHTPVVCQDNNPCTTDTCNATAGCQYLADNAASCTDSDPCTNDVCQSGTCVSTPIDCSAFDNDCNVGVCSGGTCQAQPANSGQGCNDGLTPCDMTGICDAGGLCIGQDDACGSLATSCATCTTGVDCYLNRLCTCATSTPPAPAILLVNGVCVEDTNECNQNPCDPLATACLDPTPDGSVTGDVICTCPPGYTGDGIAASQGCIDIDECSGQNPCGAGVAVGGCNGTSPPGSYSCTCAPGFTSVNGATGPFCGCDLSGTYALVTDATFTWDPVYVDVLGTQVLAVEGSGAAGVPVRAWSLRHQTIQSDGTMTVKTILCGGTSPTVCTPVFSRGLAQFQGNDVWGKSELNAGFPDFSVDLTGVVPGGSYVEPENTVLSGITLADPSGQWPQCAACVGNVSQCTCSGVTYPITNPAQWRDSDENTTLGVSTWAVRSGGELFGGTGYPEPPYEYPEPSECPRSSSGGPYPYGAFPGTETGSFTPFYTLEWRGATRTISQLVSTSITLSNNECSITGNVIGPDSGRALTNARFGECRTCGSIDCLSSTGNCTASQVDFYDSQPQTQQVIAATFALSRATNIDLDAVFALPTEVEQEAALNAACQEIRTTYCPAGENCTPP